MKRLLNLNRLAFSMIELMVVIAIIGVLAAIGLPVYSKFKAKARQSEAKIALAALFTAEESFRQQWDLYSVDLANIGFSVRGSKLRYVTGFEAAACTGYTTAQGAPVESITDNDTWSDGTNVNLNSAASWDVTITKPTASGTACTNNSSYIAAAYGLPGSSASDPGATGGDTWTINEAKLIRNTLPNFGN